MYCVTIQAPPLHVAVVRDQLHGPYSQVFPAVEQLAPFAGVVRGQPSARSTPAIFGSQYHLPGEPSGCGMYAPPHCGGAPQ